MGRGVKELVSSFSKSVKSKKKLFRELTGSEGKESIFGV